jgi:hypothetical protein
MKMTVVFDHFPVAISSTGGWQSLIMPSAQVETGDIDGRPAAHNNDLEMTVARAYLGSEVEGNMAVLPD